MFSLMWSLFNSFLLNFPDFTAISFLCGHIALKRRPKSNYSWRELRCLCLEIVHQTRELINSQNGWKFYILTSKIMYFESLSQNWKYWKNTKKWLYEELSPELNIRWNVSSAVKHFAVEWAVELIMLIISQSAIWCPKSAKIIHDFET